MEKSFIWKDQNKYYQLLCNSYIKKIFEIIKDKEYVFYLDNYEDYYDTAYEYFVNNKIINIDNFEKSKQFQHYKLFPLFLDYDNIYDVDVNNIGFTITDFDDDLEGNKSGCNQCKANYGGNVWFRGLAYNTGLNEENPHAPIEYEGYIKTSYFFICSCKTEYNNGQNIVCYKEKCIDEYGNEYYTNILPFLEMSCTPVNNTKDISLMRECVWFNIAYAKIENTNLWYI